MSVEGLAIMPETAQGDLGLCIMKDVEVDATAGLGRRPGEDEDILAVEANHPKGGVNAQGHMKRGVTGDQHQDPALAHAPQQGNARATAVKDPPVQIRREMVT